MKIAATVYCYYQRIMACTKKCSHWIMLVNKRPNSTDLIWRHFSPKCHWKLVIALAYRIANHELRHKVHKTGWVNLVNSNKKWDQYLAGRSSGWCGVFSSVAQRPYHLSARLVLMVANLLQRREQIHQQLQICNEKKQSPFVVLIPSPDRFLPSMNQLPF